MSMGAHMLYVTLVIIGDLGLNMGCCTTGDKKPGGGDAEMLMDIAGESGALMNTNKTWN